MVGLQGGGKTTTTAKIAKRLKEREGKKVLMGLARREPPRGDGTAGEWRSPRHQIGRRHAAHRQGRRPGRHRQTRQDAGQASAATTSTSSTRRARLSIDEELMAQVEAVSRRGQPPRNPAGRRWPDGQDARP